ncbi:hypothetical protein KVR01_011779 [Diaporthe batatas]|uniref:uncharacterized protein n=1 Tax=Diaporthe batatas TaxID=748121 RepID=UPI001D049059|nr:uncharacterized protein KVR01_011779 [Diaporthe batatas]KAG8158657.1 hypothetical protein KVR01_011779 [Diaporthe batatas]
MDASPQSPPARAKAQTPQLERILNTERDKLLTVVREHETKIDSLKRSFKESQQALIDNVEDALNKSYQNRDEIERRLQEEQQRVADLTKKLDETKNNEVTTMLAFEKRNHGLTKIDLCQSKSQLAESLRRVVDLVGNLNATERDNSGLRRKCNRLSTTIEAINESKALVEGELELSRSESADIQQRLKTAEQRNMRLEADLKVATERYSGAEVELRTFKSLFNRINDDMSSLAPSSAQQPTVTQSKSSTPVPGEQGSAEHRASRLRTDDSVARPQHSDHQASSSATRNKLIVRLRCNSILDEVMDTTQNWGSNQYFLNAMDPLTLASRDAKVGPMNLGTMKEKLAEGAYNSFTSFKADFDSMIADAKRLNTPQNAVRIAAEQLSEIFDRAFSSQPVSHGPPEHAGPAEGASGNKRKAGTDTLASEDVHAQKRRSLPPPKHAVNRATLRDPAHAAQSKDISNGTKQTDAQPVKRKLWTGARIHMDATLSTVAQLVSVTKTPDTVTGHWKSLVPDEYWVTSHAVKDPISDKMTFLIHCDGINSLDVIILRLMPTAETDKPEFDRVFNHFLQRERFANVSHAQTPNVVSIYLIPASKADGYPYFFPTLDADLLPPNRTEDVLFMVIIFRVASDRQIEIRDAWDERMKAVSYHHRGGLASMRSILVRNHLTAFRRVLSSAESRLVGLSNLPLSNEIPPPELQVHGQDILRLSYLACDQDSLPMVNGVGVPEWVFVLGRLCCVAECHGLVVVDLQDRARSLWLLRSFLGSPSKRTITLLSNWFPRSFDEWDRLLCGGLPPESFRICLKNTGLKVERCKFR